MKNPTFAFLAAGHIGTIIAKALAPNGKGKALLTRRNSAFDAETIASFDCGYDNHAAARRADTLFLGTRPIQLDELLQEIKPAVCSDHLVISMVGRRTLHEIQNALGWCNIYRIMPSILASVKKGIILISVHPGASEQVHVRNMMSSISTEALVVTEELLNIGTIFVGSMPAIVAYFFKEHIPGSSLVLDERVRTTIIAVSCEQGFGKIESEKMLVATEDGVRTLLANGATCRQIMEEVSTKGGCTHQVLSTYEALQASLLQGDVESIVRRGLEAGITKLLTL